MYQWLAISLMLCCLPFPVAADNLNLPPLYIGLAQNDKPYTAVNSKHETSGILVNFMDSLCGRLAYKCEYGHTKYADQLDALKTGKTDALIISSQVVMPEIDPVLLTPPICKTNPVFIQKSSAGTHYKQAKDLARQRIAVKENSSFHLYLIENYADSVYIKPYPIMESAIFDLFTDRVDSIFVDEAFYQDRVYNTSLGDIQSDTQLIAAKVDGLSIPLHNMVIAFSKKRKSLYDQAVKFMSEPTKKMPSCAGLLDKKLSIIY